MASGTIEERFWMKVDKENGPAFPRHGRCWQWTAGRIYGYGQFPALGERLAHRVSYKLFVGEIPDGLYVLHKCDNPLCVRPNHLFLGTQQDNLRDMVTKRRQALGDKNGVGKITANDVVLIRQRYAQGGITHKELGKQFGVGLLCTWRIVNRKTWNHI